MSVTTRAQERTPPAPAPGPGRTRPPSRPRSRLRPRRGLLFPAGDQMLRTGHLLTVSALVTSLLGAGYWALATRLYDPAAVGRNFAAVSAMTLVASVGQLNLPNVLIRFVPAAGPRARLLTLRAYAAATAATLLAALVFVLLQPTLVPDLDFLRQSPYSIAFVLGAVGYSLFAVQDGALTGLRRPGFIVAENAGFSILKVLCLTLFAVSAAGILLSWIAALAAAVVVTNVYLFGRAAPRRGASTRESAPAPGTAPTLGYMAADYTGAMLGVCAMTLLPLFVLDRLGPAQSAYFSAAWLVTTALYLFNQNMSTSLVVEAARDQEDLRGKVRHMMRHSGLLLLVGVTVLILAAPLVLRVFGADYARHAVTAFRLLVLSALPDLLVAAVLGVARTRRRMRLVVIVYAAQAVLGIGLTLLLLPPLGLTGIGAAWLCAQTVLALGLVASHRLWMPERAEAQAQAQAQAQVQVQVQAHAQTQAPVHVEAPAKVRALPALTAAVAVPAIFADPEELDEPKEPGEPKEPAAPVRTSDQLTLTVVICAYTMDRWDQIRDAVASARGQRGRADEIVLVVDHCPPLHDRAAAELADDDVHIVRVVANRYGRGLSGARNTGIEEAHGEVIAFLDDDAAAAPGWRDALLAPYADPRVLGVGGLIRPRWADSRPAWFPREFDWVVGCTYRGMPAERAQVRNFIGANMSFRRGVLAGLGGFRSELGRVGTRPLGCEETDLCIRVAHANPGGVLLYEPAAAVDHHVPAQRATWPYYRARCFAEGLSKAAVARSVGTGSGLSSERAYLRSTIPAALARTLRPGPRHTPATTAMALAAGVAVTVAGYAVGTLRPSLTRADVAPTATATLPATGTLQTPESLSTAPAPAPALFSDPDPGPPPRPRTLDNGPGNAPDSPLRRAYALAQTWFPRLALPAAAALWLSCLSGIRPQDMNDLGLVSVLPIAFWAALALLALGFSASLSRSRTTATGWLAAHVVTLIAILHATPAIVYPELRYSWAWKHVAIVDYMLAHGGTAPNSGTLIDAYAQWPGFFAVNALIVRMTGVSSPLAYASWAPVVFNLMMVLPLVLLFRAATRDRRIVWGGVWIFFSASWIGQDYFSPQAFAFVLYLVVIALVVRRLSSGVRASSRRAERRAVRHRAQAALAAEDGSVAGSELAVPPSLPDATHAAGAADPIGAFDGIDGIDGIDTVSTLGRAHPTALWRSLLVWALLLGVPVLAIDSSHQLTPLTLTSALAALALSRYRRRLALLALGGAVLIMAVWDAFPARDFFAANLAGLLKSFGALDSNTNTVVAHLYPISPLQVLVGHADRGLTAAVCVLALLGVLVARRVRRIGLLLLALAPIPLVAASNYGGEITLRVYMFALPSLALFAAALLWRPSAPSPHRLVRPLRLRALGRLGRSGAAPRNPRNPRTRRVIGRVARTVLVPAVLLGLLGAFSVSFYGSERANYFTPGEVAAVTQLFKIAPQGSLIAGATGDVPGAYTDYPDYQQLWFTEAPTAELKAIIADPAVALAQYLAMPPGHQSFLILTRAQEAESEMAGLLPPGGFQRIETALAASPLFTLVYHDQDAVIYELVPSPESPALPAGSASRPQAALSPTNPATNTGGAP